MGLHALQQRLTEELEENLLILAAGHPTTEVGEVYEDIELYFEATACCALLVSADRVSFQKHLCWSALARQDFLRRGHAEGHADGFRHARSRSEALFRAVAAGDMALAITVGDLSPETWRPEGEYEEDFAYHLFLHRLMKGAPRLECEKALRALDSAVGSALSPRLEVCQALQEGSSEAFDDALTRLIDAHASLQDEARTYSSDIPTFEPRSRIFVEGLALLRLAASTGISLPIRDHAFCPTLGRGQPLRDRPDDLFAELAAVAARSASRQRP
ncbi:MAG: hypothetical protein EOO71_04540 [Myxococcaceae bacterium]|nr:MAG: hypothetical protein EOO71_04540 [Myxococcaceae bacterium]